MVMRSTKLKKFAKKCKDGQYTKYFKQRFRDQARTFLRDLSKQIIAYSPIYQDAPSATNSYVNHTVIQADSTATQIQPKQFGAYPGMNYVPSDVVDLDEVLALFGRWKTVPSRVYIWNRSADEFGQQQYADRVESTGWDTKPPYRPFKRGWQAAKTHFKLRSPVWYNKVFSKLVKVNEE